MNRDYFSESIQRIASADGSGKELERIRRNSFQKLKEFLWITPAPTSAGCRTHIISYRKKSYNPIILRKKTSQT